MLNLTNAVAERPRSRRWLAAAAGLALGLTAALPARAEDTIKVGILHSLSGTMAISETTLKDVVLMLIDQQNKKGGLLGKKLEAVVVDPASNWPLFAEKARELISKDKVAVVFGCWTSVSRKSVLPVFKELNSILFYPVQYEGEESERNVIYIILRACRLFKYPVKKPSPAPTTIRPETFLRDLTQKTSAPFQSNAPSAPFVTAPWQRPDLNKVGK